MLSAELLDKFWDTTRKWTLDEENWFKRLTRRSVSLGMEYYIRKHMPVFEEKCSQVMDVSSMSHREVLNRTRRNARCSVLWLATSKVLHTQIELRKHVDHLRATT